MANTRTSPHGRRATRSATTPGLPWVSELQLESGRMDEVFRTITHGDEKEVRA